MKYLVSQLGIVISNVELSMRKATKQGYNIAKKDYTIFVLGIGCRSNLKGLTFVQNIPLV